MVGSIHFEATEKAVNIRTEMYDVSNFDKFQILCALRRSLEISEKDFEFYNMLIQTGMDKRLVPESNTTEMSVSPEILEMMKGMEGDNTDEG